jgi:HEAT repeat protein
MRAIIGCGLLWCVLAGRASGEIVPSFALDEDPELKPPPPIVVFPEKHRPLWLAALARPEADLQRQAAEAIAKAHRLGTPGLSEAIPVLDRIVEADQSHPAARIAAANALIALEARDSAERLFRASQRHGLDLRQLVEPALARWKYAPAQEIWRRRLDDPQARHRELMLAIDGVRESQDVSASSALRKIVNDPLRPAAVRVAAARAVGQLNANGLESDAEQLSKRRPANITDRLCAAGLLRRHDSQAARSTLLRLATDTEPAVAAEALTRLNEIDHALVVPLAESVLKNRDANVRRQGLLALAALPTPDRVRSLARLLDDPQRDLRRLTCEHLVRLSEQASLIKAIQTGAMEQLASESWRGQEQAALVLATLDHKPAAPRFVELLESPRDEVAVAVAWGLRKLAVPDTLPAILDKATRQTELRLRTNGLSAPRDAQVAHLCEAIGLLKYAPGEPLLRRHVEKNYALGELSRSSAIWALGQIHNGVPDAALAQKIVARVTEPSAVTPPELERVRIAGAIALGRMKARSHVTALRNFVGPTIYADPVSLAIHWSLEQLTGQKLPAPERPVLFHQSGWFLSPLD